MCNAILKVLYAHISCISFIETYPSVAFPDMCLHYSHHGDMIIQHDKQCTSITKGIVIQGVIPMLLLDTRRLKWIQNKEKVYFDTIFISI